MDGDEKMNTMEMKVERDLLEEAVSLRIEKKYEESRAILLDLVKASTDPEVFYQCAWVHDAMELETEAVNFYVRGIELGLSGESLRGAYIGLGSTYRCIGEYENSINTFRRGLDEFPNDEVITVFLAMAQYNSKNYNEAMQLLLELTLKLDSVTEYAKAISYYKDNLDKTW